MKLASAILISVAHGNEKKVPPRHPLQRLNSLVEFGNEYFELFEAYFPDKFVDRWSGPEGKFAKNAVRMESAFTRGNQRCGYYSAENLPHGGPGSRERRSMSDDFERWTRDDPVKGMREILTGFRKWSERYISDCSGQRNHQHMVNRFNGFQERFDELFEDMKFSQNDEPLENEKIWHGERHIATYTTEGGYRHTFADMRRPHNMFDDDEISIWHSYQPHAVPPQIEVTFHNKIDFNKLVIVKRSDGNSAWRKRYKNVCLSLDDEQVSCTAENYGNAQDNRADTITWQHFQKGVQKVSLQFNHATDPAQVADLKIHYQREIPAGEWGEWSKCTGCWTDCSRTRTRTCEDEDATKCSEPLSETAACETNYQSSFGDMGWIWRNAYAASYVSRWLEKHDLDQCWRFSGIWWNEWGHAIGLAAPHIIIKGCGLMPQDVIDANTPRYWDNRSIDYTIPKDFKNTTTTDV